MAWGIQISWPKQQRDPLGQRRFAVARRAVEEHAGAGIDRRPRLSNRFGIDRNIADGRGELFRAGGLGGDRLGLDRDHVVHQRHGRRTDVGAGLQEAPSPAPGPRGQAVVIVVEGGRPGVDHDLVGPQRGQQRLDDAERQADVFGDRPAVARAEHRQVLADQLFDELLAQPDLFDRSRLRRAEVLAGKQRRQQTVADVQGLLRQCHGVTLAFEEWFGRIRHGAD